MRRILRNPSCVANAYGGAYGNNADDMLLDFRVCQSGYDVKEAN